jgi:hypothetical protein
VLPIKQVQEFFHLGWDTMKSIDHAALERWVGPPSFDGVDVMVLALPCPPCFPNSSRRQKPRGDGSRRRIEALGNPRTVF